MEKENPLGRSDQELLAALQTIPGLDVAAGLVYLQGKVGSYWRIVERFANHHQKDIETLKGLLLAGDLEAAERVAHSLKGVAGTLGATHLQSRAAELNRALKERRALPDVENLLTLVASELSSFCCAVAALPTQDAPLTAPCDLDEVKQVLATLEPLLAMGDMESNQVLRTNGPLLVAALGQSAADLQDLADRYDYQGAHLALLAIRRRLG